MQTAQDDQQGNTKQANAKAIDWKIVFGPKKELIQKYIEILKTKDTPQDKELVEELKKIEDEPDFLPNQSKLRNLLLKMKQKGIEDKVLELVASAYYIEAQKRVSSKINTLLDHELVAEWSDFMETKPNQMQIFLMLNFLCKNLFGEEMDVLVDVEIGNILATYFAEKEVDLKIDSQLQKSSPEKLEQFSALLGEGRAVDAFNLLFED